MRRLISPWRWSVPLCFGMTRSISRRRSKRSRGSRALRNAASAALYSGVRLAGMIALAQKPAPYVALVRLRPRGSFYVTGAGLARHAIGAFSPALMTDDQTGSGAEYHK